MKWDIPREKSSIKPNWPNRKSLDRLHSVGAFLRKVFGNPKPFFQKGFWPPEAVLLPPSLHLHAELVSTSGTPRLVLALLPGQA
jgi:hypothetical protein